MAIRKLDHLAFLVDDLEDAIAHFREMFDVGEGEVFVERDFEVEGDGGIETMDLAFIEVGDLHLELVEPTGEGSMKRMLERDGPGLHHIGVTSDSVREDWKRHASDRERVGLVNRLPDVDKFGSSYWFLHPRQNYGALIEVQSAWHRTAESHMTPLEPTPNWVEEFSDQSEAADG